MCSGAMRFGSMYSPIFFTGDGRGLGGLSTADPYRAMFKMLPLLNKPSLKTLFRAMNIFKRDNALSFDKDLQES